MSSITEQPGGSGTDTQLLDGGFSPSNHLKLFGMFRRFSISVFASGAEGYKDP